MNREIYYNDIEEKLHVLAYRIRTRSKLNVLGLNVHAENFYTRFFNTLYNLKLTNLNSSNPNAAAIDLIDHQNNIVIQVSSTNTKTKIESSLDKGVIKTYSTYDFWFISIAREAGDLRKKTFKNPHNISFNPKEDIYDVHSILQDVFDCDLDKMQEIFELTRKELVIKEIDQGKLESNLAIIINALSQEDLSNIEQIKNLNAYDIGRKIDYNGLEISEQLIEDYRHYYNLLDLKYQTFDASGVNKSLSVLQAIRSEYVGVLKNKSKQDPDDIFFETIKRVNKKIVKSRNWVEIPEDELNMCVEILVVDAFIRCKIFKNPENYNYATA